MEQLFYNTNVEGLSNHEITTRSLKSDKYNNYNNKTAIWQKHNKQS